MSRLVGDLILLAKADRPDFLTPAPGRPRARSPTTLLAKARGLGDRDWTLDETARASIAASTSSGSPRRVLQLADNAVKHTDDGDAVAIGSSYDDGRCALWVRDTGPGVPPEDREHDLRALRPQRRRPWRRGLRPRPLDRRAPSRRRTAARVTVEDAPTRRPVRDHACRRRPAPSRATEERTTWPAS